MTDSARHGWPARRTVDFISDRATPNPYLYNHFLEIEFA